jgi:16S rRNA (guanine1516-N2)-methyltransferase
MDSHKLRAVDLAKRLTLEEISDANQVAKTIISDPSAPRPDVCYVDPMFPTRTKSAAVKKNMQILHGLLGSQVDDGAQNETTERQELDLLQAASSLASRRVVVKRPRLADCLGGNLPNGLKPSYSIIGSINRWDIYVK